MFLSVISKYVKQKDLQSSIESVRQSRPFELIRCGCYFNIDLQPGYKGINILKNSYFFPNIPIDGIVLQPGDRILFFAQNDPVQNGIWNVMSIIAGYINIQRPPDYDYNTPIRSGQFVLIAEGQNAIGVLFRNITREFDDNQNKIINYIGTHPQHWEPYLVMKFNTNLENVVTGDF